MKSSTVRRSDSERTPDPESGQGAEGAPTGKQENHAWEWFKSIGVALLLFFVIRTFLVQAFTIPSGSMENTLLIGDYLMANNAIYGAQVPFTPWRVPGFREPQHGDVVVFRPTYNDPVIDVVKRVVGEPGDTLQMVDKVVYRNGDRLDEPYLEPSYLPDSPLQRDGLPGMADCCYAWHLNALARGNDPETYRPTRDNWGPLIVPPGHFMLLGDNRDQSLDSRYMGFIPRDVIRGKALFIYYSIDPQVNRPFPRFLTAVRWDRVGSVIH